MITRNDVYQAFAAYGFETAGSVCMGFFQGYALTLKPSGNGRCYLEAAVCPNENIRSFRKFYRERKPRCVSGIAADKNIVRLEFGFRSKTDFEQQADELLRSFTGALKEAGVAPAETCAVCGGAAPESLGFYNGFRPVHAGCLQDAAASVKEDVENNRLHGSYLTGSFGALLGALLGALPALLLFVLTDKLYSVTVVLIPLASMWLYCRFGGKRERPATAIIAVVSLLVLLLMMTAFLAMALAKEYGDSFREVLPYVLAFVVTGQGFLKLLQADIFSYAFLALGVWSIWCFGFNDGWVNGAETAVTTLRPNPAYMPAQNDPVYENDTGDPNDTDDPNDIGDPNNIGEN